MKCERRIHHGWTEQERIKKEHPEYNHPLFGKYQYIYSSKSGKISLIELVDYYKDGNNVWEIYVLKGDNLFPDVERFKTKREAEKRIKEVLGG